MAKQELFIALQPDEDFAESDCECRLEKGPGGDPQFFQCDLHQSAPRLLEALEVIVENFPEIGTDEELNGGDAIDRLANLWPVIIGTIRAAKGEV